MANEIESAEAFVDANVEGSFDSLARAVKARDAAITKAAEERGYRNALSDLTGWANAKGLYEHARAALDEGVKALRSKLETR